MHTDTAPQLDDLSARTRTVPTIDGASAAAPRERGPLRRFTHWARFADGCALAELEVDGTSGEITRLYYRIDTARTGTVEVVRRDPTTDAGALFLGAAVSVSRGMHRNFPGDTTACRSVLELVSALESRCAATLRELATTVRDDRKTMH
jgi:hypothetical protein